MFSTSVSYWAPVGAFDCCQGKNAEAGQHEAGLGQILARDAALSWLAGQYQAKKERAQEPGHAHKCL